MDNEKKVVKTEVAEISYEPDSSLITIEYFDNKLITKEDAEKVINISLELTGGKPFGVISIFKTNLVNKDAQEVLRQNSPNLVAVASIIKNEILRVSFNTFMAFKRIGYKFKLFTDIEKAKEWVKKEIKAYNANS